MSGGLVIGLRRNVAGRLEAGLVGIQSAWLPGLELLKVCPHNSIFRAISSVLGGERAEQTTENGYQDDL